MRLTTRVSCAVLSATLLSQLSTCGMLFYPGRCGQIDGRIDPAIVASDAIGLLFCTTPGPIALGIDLAIGAIYPPDTKYSVAPEVFKDAAGTDGKVDNRKLKTILEREIGRELPLDNPRLICHSGSAERLAAYGLKPAV